MTLPTSEESTRSLKPRVPPRIGANPPLFGKRDVELLERRAEAETLEAAKRELLSSGIGTRQCVTIHADGDACTVLLVEDDRLVRLAVQHYLEQGGHRVLAGNRDREALRISRTHSGRIDVLLTDILMPGLPGPELAAALLRERPRMRSLFMSAQPREALIADGRLQGNERLLQKPFGAPELLAAIEELASHRGTSR